MKMIKKIRFNTILLAVLSVGLMIAGFGCGGGGGDTAVAVGVSSQTVTGVAAVGAALSGEASIKDSLNTERKTVIGSDGSYALNVTGMTGPFVLRAIGSNGGVNYTLYSFAGSTGIANINPLTNALVANAGEVNDPADVYQNPNAAELNSIKTRLPQAISDLQAKLRPLLMIYSAENINPISSPYRVNHTQLDGVFDDVRISLVNGVLTIINAANSAVIFTAQVNDIPNGIFTSDENALPAPGNVPDAPTGLSSTGGANQATLSWNAVGNATSYNLYWSTTSGVTKANGTKITGVSSPYIQTGLSSGTTYYYVATAVNNVGESVASAEASATTVSSPPPPAVPAAPTGLIATGGTKQVTVSWTAVNSATSYNLYWSTTAGVTKANGTKITGVTSPVVHTGRLDATAYYYIVTAVNSAGESAASTQIAATTLPTAPSPTIPAAPNSVAAVGGNQQATISWAAVSGATSYNIYYATTTGVTVLTGTKIAGVTSPYIQTGLSAGTTYYYIVTAVNNVGESAASTQASAATNAPPPSVPPAPGGVTAAGGAKQVTVSWASSSGATSYNIYWSRTAGVTTVTGTKITGATSPYIQTGLLDGTTYYYIVTAANSAGESAASAQVSAVTNAPLPTVPSAPTGVTAVGGAKQVTISWPIVASATSYNIYWSAVTGVTKANGTKITGTVSPYIHTGRVDGTAYYYIVTAVNGVGEGAASAQVTAATTPAAIDGAALYVSNCQRCHGALASSDIAGRTVQSVKNSGMTFGLTDAQIQAIINLLP